MPNLSRLARPRVVAAYKKRTSELMQMIAIIFRRPIGAEPEVVRRPGWSRWMGNFVLSPTICPPNLRDGAFGS